MAENTTTEYLGGYSSMDPEKGDDRLFTGYSMSAGDIGMSTDARTANVLQEVSTKLSMGVKVVELSQVSPEVFESIPQGQLKEVNRLAKLTGTEITLHAPVVEPSGVGQQGFDESQRQAVERQMTFAMQKAHELNPQGNSPVTFHASGQLPGTQWKFDKKGQNVYDEEGTRVAQQMIAVNKETGQMSPIKEETLFYPGRDLKKGDIMTAKEALESANSSNWRNEINKVLFHKESADKILDEVYPVAKDIYFAVQQNPKIFSRLSPHDQDMVRKVQIADQHLHDAHLALNSTFNKAYEFGEENRGRLKKISEDFGKNMGMDVTEKKLGSMSQREMMEWDRNRRDLKNTSNNIQHMTENLRGFNPDMFESVEDFAIHKSSETFGNVAFNSFKKFGKKSSIVSIENPPAGGAVATGEELKNLVKASQEQFIKRATEDGMSKSEATREAKRLIGVTWDVGHINMLRKQGASKESLLKETEHIAPFVKHVHLSDNFGMEHTELPMGMGNTPVKEIMEKIGKEGYKGKKIVEALHWWQHFKTPPFKETLGAFGSPIYSDGAGPAWNQTLGFQQNYPSGYGMMLPQTHYQLFGSGFAQLPTELGGQMPGAQGSRMSGNAME